VEVSPSGVSLFYIGMVISVLLLVSGIESNPGPGAYTLEDVIKKLDEMNKNIAGINLETTELGNQIRQLTKQLEQSQQENEKTQATN